MEEEVSVGEWLITFIIFSIPIIGFIMLFVWAFGDNTKISKRNWARAMLISIFALFLLALLLNFLMLEGVFFGFNSSVNV